MKKIVVLASGSGTTFEALVDAEKNSRLHAHISALVVDRECKATERAKRLDIRCYPILYKKNPSGFANELSARLTELAPDFVLLCGFLRKVPLDVVHKYAGRIFNSHPALLPRHGGPGLYGHKVHQAVFDAHDAETGVSFHHVTENYGEGPVVAQKRVPVTSADTAETIEEKVKAVEKEFLIEQINALVNP